MFLRVVWMKGQWKRVGPVLCCVLSGCFALSCDTWLEIDHVFLLFMLLQLWFPWGYEQILSKGDLTCSSSSSSSSEF